MTTRFTPLVLSAATACAIACGSSATTPTATATVTIAGDTVTPAITQIAAGSRVLFVNNDTHAHTITSDPHPENDLCPEINQVGFLAAGASRETGNFVTAETCGFHDDGNFMLTTMQGQIVIK